MSNIDKRALREAAERAKDNFIPCFRAPTRDVLALLDELEAKDNRINRLEAIVAVAEQRNALMREWKRALRVPCDLIDDQVPVVIHSMVIRLERLKEAEAKLEAAEKQIAELEAREVVLPSTQDVHPLGPQSAKIFCEFHRSIVNRCADEIRKVGVKVSIKGN